MHDAGLPDDPPTSMASRTPVVLSLLGLAAAPMTALIASNGYVTLAMLILSVVAIVGGLVIFLAHGGRFITAAGIYCLTAGLMCGSGAWYWAGHFSALHNERSVFVAALSIYASTGLMYLLWWRNSLDARSCAYVERRPLAPDLARNCALLGAGLFVVGAAAQSRGLSLGTLAASTAEVGVVLFAASLLLSGGVRLLRSPIRTLSVAASLMLFFLVVFHGAGRLRVATVVIAIAVLAQCRLRILIKAIAVVAVVPTLLLFASIGQSRLIAQTGKPSLLAPASGLGSLVNPLGTYAQLTQEHVTGGNGSTFLAEALTPVPRAIWPNKPVQFGKVVVQHLRPEQADTNSMPALAQGEWYYNFAWLGIVLMVPILGWIILWLDRSVARRRDTPTTLADLCRLVLFSILVGSVADLAWGGLATWEVRNIQRFLVLLPFVLWGTVLHGNAPKRQAARGLPQPQLRRAHDPPALPHRP